MSRFPRTRRLSSAVVPVAILLCGVPQAANAQLRALHAIRYVTLAPPPSGAEKLHKDLTDWLRQSKMLVEAAETLPIDEPIWSWSEPAPRSRFAHCTLRTNLPQPRAIGLECSDYAGKYVGMIRFSSEIELRRWAGRRYNLPAARPLTTVRYIFVGPLNDDRHHIVEYVKGLLRADGTFTVLDSDDGVPADQSEHLVWCEIRPFWGGSGRTSFSRLTLKDRFGRAVRVFDGSSSVWLRRRTALQRAMRHAVQQLLLARAEDEEIYRVPGEGAPH